MSQYSAVRKFKRIPFHIFVDYEDKQGFCKDYTVNLSKGGTCIFTDQNLERGSEIRLHFRVPDCFNFPVLMAEVSWVKDSDSPKAKYEAGVEFLFANEEEKEIFYDLVNEIEDEYSKTENKKPSVLIVDDDKFITTMVKDALESKDLEVLTTDNPFETSYLIRSFSPNMVLLDVNMPSVKGGDICRTLKNFSIFKDLKVYFLSSMDEEELRKYSNNCGADGFFTKAQISTTFANKVVSILQN